MRRAYPSARWKQFNGTRAILQRAAWAPAHRGNACVGLREMGSMPTVDTANCLADVWAGQLGWS